MISNKSPAKTANTIKGISLKGFFVCGPFGFAIIRAIKPARGPQSAKNTGLASFYQCCLNSPDTSPPDAPAAKVTVRHSLRSRPEAQGPLPDAKPQVCRAEVE
jgi:hypothetical protein